MRAPVRGPLFRIAGLLLALGVLCVQAPTTAPAEAADGKRPVARVRALFRPEVVKAGSLVTVAVRGEEFRNVGGVAFDLVFDPSALRPVPEGFTEGPLLRRDDTGTTFMARTARSGDRIVVGLSRLGAERGARGNGPLCRLTFRALKPGRTKVRFERAVLMRPDSISKPARFIPARLRIRQAGGSGP